MYVSLGVEKKMKQRRTRRVNIGPAVLVSRPQILTSVRRLSSSTSGKSTIYCVHLMNIRFKESFALSRLCSKSESSLSTSVVPAPLVRPYCSCCDGHEVTGALHWRCCSLEGEHCNNSGASSCNGRFEQRQDLPIPVVHRDGLGIVL